MAKKSRKKLIEEMSHDEMKKEMTEIITSDILKFVETVTRKRVGLFVEEIYKGIRP